MKKKFDEKMKKLVNTPASVFQVGLYGSALMIFTGFCTDRICRRINELKDVVKAAEEETVEE